MGAATRYMGFISNNCLLKKSVIALHESGVPIISYRSSHGSYRTNLFLPQPKKKKRMKDSSKDKSNSVVLVEKLN